MGGAGQPLSLVHTTLVTATLMRVTLVLKMHSDKANNFPKIGRRQKQSETVDDLARGGSGNRNGIRADCTLIFYRVRKNVYFTYDALR